mgnify:CR=1 FL=1
MLFIIEQKQNLNYDVVDDLSLGLLMKNKNYTPEKVSDNGFIEVASFLCDNQINHNDLINMVKSNQYVFYKNKNYVAGERIDVAQMKIILED